MKNIKFKKKKRISKNLVAIICVAVCAVVVAGIFLITKAVINKKNDIPKPEGYSFETKGFECMGCSNNCEIIRVMKNKEIIDSWGNRCPKGELVHK